jgi:transposase InsO family protein
MSANQACFPITVVARVLGVSTAGYYAWRHHPPSAHARADEALLARIKTVHISSRQTYGAPRVHAELRAAGERHGRKRIARLMRAAGLVGASRRRGGPTTTRPDHDMARQASSARARSGRSRLPGSRPEPAVGRRHYPGLRRGRLYVPTAAGFLYLAVVVDVWSRRVVGWAMANHLRAELVVDALNMALGQRRPREVMHHSDQAFRPGKPIYLAGFRQALQGSRRTARDGLGRGRRSLSSGRRSRTRGTTPCARASLPPSNANCSSGAASPHKSRHAGPASASSKASTIPLGGIPPWGIARPLATNKRCKQTDSPPPPEPSTKSGHVWTSGNRGSKPSNR